jgi:hypothetical protein
LQWLKYTSLAEIGRGKSIKIMATIGPLQGSNY